MFLRHDQEYKIPDYEEVLRFLGRLREYVQNYHPANIAAERRAMSEEYSKLKTNFEQCSNLAEMKAFFQVRGWKQIANCNLSEDNLKKVPYKYYSLKSANHSDSVSFAKQREVYTEILKDHRNAAIFCQQIVPVYFINTMKPYLSAIKVEEFLDKFNSYQPDIEGLVTSLIKYVDEHSSVELKKRSAHLYQEANKKINFLESEAYRLKVEKSSLVNNNRGYVYPAKREQQISQYIAKQVEAVKVVSRVDEFSNELKQSHQEQAEHFTKIIDQYAYEMIMINYHKPGAFSDEVMQEGWMNPEEVKDVVRAIMDLVSPNPTSQKPLRM